MHQSLNAQPRTRAKCSQGHPLTLTNDIRKIDPKYVTGIYSCDSCEKPFDARIHLCAHCTPCEFDLCPSCLQKCEIASNNHAKTTSVTCSRGHPLVLTNDLRRIDPKYVTGMYTCDDCEMPSDSRIHPCAHCTICEFDLCPSCFQKQENKQKMTQSRKASVPCPEGHALILTNDLKSIDPKYITGIYGCDFCDQSFDPKFFLCAHCTACEFDLCPNCFRRYKMKWQAGQADSQKENIENIFAHLSIQEKPKTSAKKEEKPKSLEKKEEVKQENGKSEKVINEDKFCVVCMEAEKSHLFIPCGHLCVCDKCSSEVISRKGTCPMCRSQIQSKIRVYL